MKSSDVGAVDSGSGVIGGERLIELLAGRHPNGEIIIESVLVAPQKAADTFQLLKSPVFVRGLARADVVQSLPDAKGAFKILRHGGNLCIRVFSKANIGSLEQTLSPEMEKLDGDMDVKEDHALVYSIHVSCGFNELEKVLTEQLKPHPEAAWYYGNVYDPETGEPLNWWQSILAPE